MLQAHIDEAGGGSMLEGAFQLIDDGWYQREIADAAYDFERRMNTGQRITVGVNAYTEGNDDDEIELLKITNDDEQRQIKRLGAVKADRDGDAVHRALEDLKAQAADPEVNLMPALIETVKTRATLGEINDSLAEVFGRYVEQPFI